MILPEDTPGSPAKNQQPLPVAAEGAPPPSYPGHEPIPRPIASASQPLYMPVPVGLPIRHTEPAGRRFLRAFVIAVAVWALVGMVTSSIAEVARYVGRRDRPNRVDDGRQDSPERHTAWPLPGDGKQIRCTNSPEDWTHEDGQVVASFDLPLTADVLYAFSRGVQSTGNIVITQDERIHDTDKVHVDVVAVHSTPNFLTSVAVCSLQRRPGEYGVGIFTPLRYPWSTRLPTLDFEVTIRLPKLSASHPLQIATLETNLPLFAHRIGDLGEHVLFGSLDLRTNNARISSQSVNATYLAMETSNAAIEGNFEASDSLKLTTTNGKIDAQAILRNDGGRSSSNAVLKTTNAHCVAGFNLKSSQPDRTGGAFQVQTLTTNGRLSVDFLDTPVDSKLKLTARTTNAAASASLHPAYEGSFRVKTSNGQSNIIVNDKVEDPSGRGRQRTVLASGTVGSGKVVWDGAHMGTVDVATQNGPVTLKV